MNNFKVLFEIKGALKTVCDHCKKVIGGAYENKGVSASLRNEDGDLKHYNYCDSSCLVQHAGFIGKKKK